MNLQFHAFQTLHAFSIALPTCSIIFFFEPVRLAFVLHSKNMFLKVELDMASALLELAFEADDESL